MWKFISVIVICVCTIYVVAADNDNETTTEPLPDGDTEEFGRKCQCRCGSTDAERSRACRDSPITWLEIHISSPLKPCDWCTARQERGCGERNEASRIVGGVETAVNEFPWVARLSYHNTFYCGGSLINDRYVLTAAHCVKSFMWFMIKVTLGEHNRCNTTHRPVTRFVVQVVAHNFTFTNFRDDIAVLKLNKPVQVTESVKPVCLPRNDDTTYTGVKAIAAGWGTVAEGKNHSCYLQEVELPILSNEACKNAKYTPNMIGDGMLCAGYPDQGNKDTCQGDSGGPLSAERRDKRHEQLGVVSWGIGCGRPGYPGVYTRITKYLDWIRNIANSGCFCSA